MTTSLLSLHKIRRAGQFETGVALPSAFSGAPAAASVTFAAPFADTTYAVLANACAVGDAQFLISVQNKTVNGFELHLGTGSVSALDHVAWTAIAQ